MTIATNIHHVEEAIEFFKKTNLYMAVGRSTAWTDEEAPPADNADATVIEEIIGYKKIDSIYLVTPDVNGTIVYRSQKFKIVAEADAFTQGAKYVYVEAKLLYDQFPLTTFRQVGLFAGTTRKAGVEDKSVLLPSEVESPGKLRVIGNYKKQERFAEKKETLSFILEF